MAKPWDHEWQGPLRDAVIDGYDTTTGMTTVDRDLLYRLLQEHDAALKAATVPMSNGELFIPKEAKAIRTAVLLAADAGGTFLAMFQRKVGDLETEIKKMNTALTEIELAAMLICGSPITNVHGMKETAQIIVEKIEGLETK